MSLISAGLCVSVGRHIQGRPLKCMYLAVFVSFPVSAASIGSVRETYSWSGLGLLVMYLGVNYLKVKGSPKESGCDPDSSSTPPKVERFELRPLLNNPDKNNSPHLRTAPIPIPIPQAGPAGRAHLRCALMLSQPHVGLLPCTHVQPVLAQPSKGKRLMQLFQRFST